MGAGEIISIILAVVAVVLACLVCFTQVKGIVFKVANEAINAAEDQNLAGSEKMEKAIDFVLTKIPAVFRIFITKEYIQKIIQAVFDKIKLFVAAQDSKK